MLKQLKFTYFVLLGILALTFSVSAQDETLIPSVTVSEQLVTADSVIIDEVVSTDFGFIVIHADNGNGSPGAVIGYAALRPGFNQNVNVVLDMVNVTPTLFAMLHTDDNAIGTYEFGEVDGADAPVSFEGDVVTIPFELAVISTHDQFVDADNFNQVMIDVVSLSTDGWLVVHADNGEGAPGTVLGQTFLESGTTLDVPVVLQGDITNTLYPMLHLDTGQAERYEFGEVEGADAPVMIADNVAVTSFATVPSLDVDDQVVVGSDATRSREGTVVFLADGVLSEGAGWLVVHADNGEGTPGEVIGFAPVLDGFNDDVLVELAAEDVTPTLFPMLHRDTGETEVYEFGDVEGADLPVTVNDEVLVTSVVSIPFITYEGTLEGDVLTIDSALIDRFGWLVIHADNGEGTPGEVVGFAPLQPGLNSDIQVAIDTNALTDTVYPMLHYDTSEAGVYEFGTVESADGPVVVNGEAIFDALTLNE